MFKLLLDVQMGRPVISCMYWPKCVDWYIRISKTSSVWRVLKKKLKKYALHDSDTNTHVHNGHGFTYWFSICKVLYHRLL